MKEGDKVFHLIYGYGTVSLFGTHAFEWSIVIASDNSITMQTFKKGDIARKEFNKYKRKR